MAEIVLRNGGQGRPQQILDLWIGHCPIQHVGRAQNTLVPDTMNECFLLGGRISRAVGIEKRGHLQAVRVEDRGEIDDLARRSGRDYGNVLPKAILPRLLEQFRDGTDIPVISQSLDDEVALLGEEALRKIVAESFL